MENGGMTDGGLRCEVPDGHSGVMVVTMDRPPANALSRQLTTDLRLAFLGFRERRDLRCVVLTGAGERVFNGGADVKEMSVRTVESMLDRSVGTRDMFEAIRRCPVPVIGAVNGHAVGAGTVIASLCDIVLAAEDATFSLPEITIGVMGGTRHAKTIVPDKVMRYMALTGRRVSAQFLERVGGVMQVVPRAALMREAMALADDIATRSPSAVRLMKEAINLTEDMPVANGYRVEQLFTTLASALPDAKEASTAWLERRKPVWSE